MNLKQKQILNSARIDLLIIFGFAAANIVCSVLEIDLFFQFGFTSPLLISQVLFYNGVASCFWVGTLLNVILSAAFLICWNFSKKKKYGYFVTAEIIYFIDFLSVLFLMFYTGEYLFYLLSTCVHIFVIIALHRSAVICFKEEKEPIISAADVNISELNMEANSEEL